MQKYIKTYIGKQIEKVHHVGSSSISQKGSLPQAVCPCGYSGKQGVMELLIAHTTYPKFFPLFQQSILLSLFSFLIRKM